MKTEINHTYTMKSYTMEVDGSNWLVKEGFDPNDDERKIHHISLLLENGGETVYLAGSDEWKRIENVFQTNDFNVEE